MEENTAIRLTHIREDIYTSTAKAKYLSVLTLQRV